MTNETPCGRCKHFDPIFGPKVERTKRGQCAARSIYPAVEGPGQLFPPGVQRAAQGQLAKPFIVKKDQVLPVCAHVKDAGFDPIEEKQRQLTEKMTRKDGRRIHR